MNFGFVLHKDWCAIYHLNSGKLATYTYNNA